MTDEVRHVVLVKPGDILVIGNIDFHDGAEAAKIAQAIKEDLGIRVIIADSDITIGKLEAGEMSDEKETPTHEEIRKSFAEEAGIPPLAPPVTKHFVTMEEIDNLYSYHPPVDEVIKNAHENVRMYVRELAHNLNDILAESPEKTHLLRQVLPEVMMRANQVVAIHGVTDEWRHVEWESNG